MRERLWRRGVADGRGGSGGGGTTRPQRGWRRRVAAGPAEPRRRAPPQPAVRRGLIAAALQRRDALLEPLEPVSTLHGMPCRRGIGSGGRRGAQEVITRRETTRQPVRRYALPSRFHAGVASGLGGHLKGHDPDQRHKASRHVERPAMAQPSETAPLRAGARRPGPVRRRSGPRPSSSPVPAGSDWRDMSEVVAGNSSAVPIGTNGMTSASVQRSRGSG